MGLVAAIRFLTIVPFGRADGRLEGVNWYPVAGLLVAAIVGLVAWAGGEAWEYGPVAAVLTISAWAILTGALHLDGLADSADAAFAPVEPSRRLEILRDVHHGTFAMVAVGLVLLLKFSALSGMSATEAAASAAAAALAGRALLPLAIARFPAMPGSRMAAAVRHDVTPAGVVAGAGIGIAGVGVCLGFEGVAVLAGAWVAGLGVLWWLSVRFGGVGGDALGAFVEVTEAAFLLGAAALWSHSRLEPFPWA